jgi:hypothetical protein
MPTAQLLPVAVACLTLHHRRVWLPGSRGSVCQSSAASCRRRAGCRRWQVPMQRLAKIMCVCSVCGRLVRPRQDCGKTAPRHVRPDVAPGRSRSRSHKASTSSRISQAGATVHTFRVGEDPTPQSPLPRSRCGAAAEIFMFCTLHSALSNHLATRGHPAQRPTAPDHRGCRCVPMRHSTALISQNENGGTNYIPSRRAVHPCGRSGHSCPARS